MKTRKLPNGGLELSESWPLVRWACAALALLLPALVLFGVIGRTGYWNIGLKWAAFGFSDPMQNQ